jgi:myosin I
VYKSLQDNNEDQCIIMLGMSASGKTENSRQIVKFLSKISGKNTTLLQRQRSSNAIYTRSSPKSSCSTPRHHILPMQEKSSCFKTEGAKNKKISRVEFDFSYKSTDELETKHDVIKYCPKHNCSNQIMSVSTISGTTSNPIDIPIRRKNMHYQVAEMPAVSKSFSIYETMNRVHTKIPNCFEHSEKPEHARCESLDLTAVNNHHFNNNLFELATHHKDDGESVLQMKNPMAKSNKINLEHFKSGKRKEPNNDSAKANCLISNNEIQVMKERIAQAEVFLNAMGNASTSKNRDSSRFVSFLFLFDYFLLLCVIDILLSF